MTATFSFDQPSRVRRPGIVAGIAVSLVLHAVLLFGYRLSSPPAPAQPAKAMTVWLQPARPPRIVARVEPPPKPEKREVARVTPRARSTPAPAPAAEEKTAVAAQTPLKPAESQAITLPPAPDPLHADQQPRTFDMNAALKTARKVANDKDPARAGLPVAQLDDHPLYPENHTTKLQSGIASAKKDDCLQKGAGAGLLAPLIWALDKHCKF
ncbi:hypothetical protein GJ697_15245 [Pseudoduganella sp. FT25W]|uniref:Uncharacterized protein n=1 Tax=Duganella alba TaxID=2666081 RepID=A0A6L5QHI2_9BURK|nr:hypothetical protein [Duganella alba]MRX09197.1 hypothetical protein [Duganella alba]MRX17281.1 hypothetical protein [Duganella alba]